MGKSLYEPDLLETARAIAAKVNVPLPTDVVVAKEFAESAAATVKLIADVAADDMILDIGQESVGDTATHDQQVADLAQAVQYFQFGRHLGAGNNRRHRFGRGAQGLAQCFQLSGQQRACGELKILMISVERLKNEA